MSHMPRSPACPSGGACSISSSPVLAWGTAGAAASLLFRVSDLGPLALSFWRCAGGLALLLRRACCAPCGRRRPARGRTEPRRRRLVRIARHRVGLTLFQSRLLRRRRGDRTRGRHRRHPGRGARAHRARRAADRWASGSGGAGSPPSAGRSPGCAVLVLGGDGGDVRPVGRRLWPLLSAAGYAAMTLLTRWLGRTGGAATRSSTTAWAFARRRGVPAAARRGRGTACRTPPNRRRCSGCWCTWRPCRPRSPTRSTSRAPPSVRAATVSVIMLLEPVSAAVIAVALLGERLTAATVVGTLLLLAAVAGWPSPRRAVLPRPAGGRPPDAEAARRGGRRSEHRRGSPARRRPGPGRRPGPAPRTPWATRHHARPVRQREVLRRRRSARRCGPWRTPRRGPGGSPRWRRAPWRRRAGSPADRPGTTWSTMASSADAPLLRVGHLVGDAVDHHRAVVDRVVEGGPGQHQTVHMRHGQADRRGPDPPRPPSRSGREPVEPCTYSRSPTLAKRVGRTTGAPSRTKPRWQR